MFLFLRARNIFLCFVVFIILISVLLFFSKSDVSVNAGNPSVIIVDAGHGGVDGGALGLYNIVEKDLNLEIAKKVQALLISKGFTVVMTRDSDISIHSSDKKTIRDKKTSDLLNRAELANKSGAGLYVSIHLNTYEQESISGAQVFYKKDDAVGQEYAKKIMSELKTIDNKNKRTEKILPNPNLLFKKLQIPAVLIECGFISNNSDALLLKSEEYQQSLAGKIVNGIFPNISDNTLLTD